MSVEAIATTESQPAFYADDLVGIEGLRAWLAGPAPPRLAVVPEPSDSSATRSFAPISTAAAGDDLAMSSRSGDVRGLKSKIAVKELAQWMISAETERKWRAHQRGEIPADSVRQSLLEDLNAALRQSLREQRIFWEDERGTRDVIPPEVQELMRRDAEEDVLYRLNMDFLERAFEGMLDVHPYRGPTPFCETDEYRFFGRRREAAEIVARVISHEAVLVYAPSGAGKTSLINAKVVPMLRREGCDVLPPTRVQGPVIPETSPVAIQNPYVFHALNRCCQGDAGIAGQIDPSRLAGMTLADFLGQRAGALPPDLAPAPTVLIFDQFEELFTFYPEQWEKRRGFFRQVREALEANRLLRVLFLMREDFVAEVDPYAGELHGRLRMRLRLERLKRPAALEAITEPLRRTKRRFDEDAAELLVDKLLRLPSPAHDGEDVHDEFVEPVQLQVVCQRLWTGLDADVLEIRREIVERLADVAESLSEFYDRSIARAVAETGVKEGTVRGWFEKNLITSSGTRGMVFRGEQRTGGLPNAVVDLLEREYIVKAELRGGRRWYELSHDRFIPSIHESNRQWRGRITGKTDARFRWLGERAAKWCNSARPVELLLNADEITQADQYIAVLDAMGIDRDPDFLAFVKASRDAVEETARRHELAQARAESGANRRRLSFALAALAAVATGLIASSYYWSDAARARREAEEAEHVARTSARTALVADGMLSFAAGDLPGAQLRFLEAQANMPSSTADRVRLGLTWPLLPKIVEVFDEPGMASASVSGDGRFLLMRMRIQSGSPHSGELRLRDLTAGDSTPLSLMLSTGKSRLECLGIAWPPAGHRFVTLGTCQSDSRTWVQVWNAETGKPLTPAYEHPGEVSESQAVLTSDGRWLVTACGPQVFARDISDPGRGTKAGGTGRPLKEHKKPVAVLRAWTTPEAKAEGGAVCWVLSADKAGEAYLMRTDQTQPIAWPREPAAVFAADVSRDGKTLVVGGQGGVPQVWTLNADGTWRLGKRFQRVGSDLSRIVVSPDGRRFAATTTDLRVFVWDFIEGSKPLELPHNTAIFDISFSPSGLFLITAGRDRVACVWRCDSNRVRAMMHHIGSVNSARFLPDGRHVFTRVDTSVSADGIGLLWAVEPFLPEVHFAGRIVPGGACFDAATRRLMTTETDGSSTDGERTSAAFYSFGDVPDKPRQVAKFTSPNLRAAAFSATGRHAVLVDGSNEATIRNADDGSPVATLRCVPGEQIVSAACDSLGNAILVTEHRDASENAVQTLRFWNWEPSGGGDPREQSSTNLSPRETANFAGFSRDGSAAVVGTTRLESFGERGSAHVYRLPRPGKDAPPEVSVHHDGPVTYAVFSRDARRLLTASKDDTAKLSDLDESAKVLRFCHTADVCFAAFDPAEQHVVTCSDDHTARVWDAVSGEPTTPELLHDGYVRHAVFNGDGSLLLTASLGGTASVWEAKSGEFAGMLRSPDPVQYVFFGPSENVIGTVGETGSLDLWPPGTSRRKGDQRQREASQVRVRLWKIEVPDPKCFTEGKVQRYLELLAARRFENHVLTRMTVAQVISHREELGPLRDCIPEPTPAAVYADRASFFQTSENWATAALYLELALDQAPDNPKLRKQLDRVRDHAAPASEAEQDAYATGDAIKQAEDIQKQLKTSIESKQYQKALGEVQESVRILKHIERNSYATPPSTMNQQRFSVPRK